MKGFSHFMSGVAVASFGPWAIEAAQNGNPIFFVLGGACGILLLPIACNMSGFGETITGWLGLT